MSQQCQIAIKLAQHLLSFSVHPVLIICKGGRRKQWVGMKVQRLLGQDGDWGPENLNKGYRDDL